MVPFIVLIIPTLAISLVYKFYRTLFVTPIDVKDKVVLITGASSGLGEACAKVFTSAGCKVILCARNEKQLSRVKKEINRDDDESSEWPLVCKMDVTQSSDISSCVDMLAAKNIKVDILISNAGMSQRGSVSESVLNVYENLMAVNYFGPVNLAKAFLPLMISQRNGFIVSIGSIQAKFALPFRSAYTASKHASEAFFDSLRSEVAKDNIKVAVVNPGYIRTNLSLNALSGDGSKHGVLDPTTENGMDPEWVAQQVLACVVYQTSELNLIDTQSSIAMYTRTFVPSLFFKAMEWRANSHFKKLKKST